MNMWSQNILNCKGWCGPCLCWNLFSEIQGGSGVGWHWFTLAEIMILFSSMCCCFIFFLMLTQFKFLPFISFAISTRVIKYIFIKMSRGGSRFFALPLLKQLFRELIYCSPVWQYPLEHSWQTLYWGLQGFRAIFDDFRDPLLEQWNVTAPLEW